MANELYPDEASKIDRLRKLQIEVDKRFSGGVGEASGASPSIKDYCGVHTINFVWYDYGGPDMVLNDEQLAQAVAEDDVEAPERNFEEYFNDFASLAPRDTIEKYTWILSWGCNNDGSPRQNGAIDWIYITHLVQDGITENGGYTKFAGQAKNSLIPPVPFILNAETKQKIRNLLNQPDFEPLRWSQQDEQLWVTNGKRELVSQLIEQLKRTFNHDRQTPG
jgi:hypothetical protein